MVRVSIVVSAVASVLLSSVAASAQEAAPPPGDGAEADAEGAADARTRALELYRQSREHYEVADYEGAAALLREAYAIHPEPNLLYNLARAYGNLGEFERAIDAYERFLKAAPDTDDRTVIEERIANYRAVLTERRAEQQKEHEQQAAAARADQASASKGDAGPNPAPWIVAGSGAAVAAAGAVLGGLAVSARNDAKDEPEFFAAQEASDRAVRLGWAANVSFALAGVLGVIGVVWGSIDIAGSSADDETDDAASASVRLGPRGVGLAW